MNARDHLGSVRELVDQGGAVRARYDFDPWGNRTKLSGDLDTEMAGFTGYWHHGPSGLEVSPTRAYSASLGRFLSRDPIAESGGVNLYAYVENDPISRSDPSGLLPILPMTGDPWLYNAIRKAGVNSVGVAVGGSATAPFGGHVEGSIGAGLFSGSSFDGYVGGGSNVGPMGVISPQNPGKAPLELNPSIGPYAGGGVSFWFSNAKSGADIASTDWSYTFNVGAGLGLGMGVALATSPEGIWQFSITPPIPSVGEGVDLSAQRTTTIPFKKKPCP